MGEVAGAAAFNQRSTRSLRFGRSDRHRNLTIAVLLLVLFAGCRRAPRVPRKALLLPPAPGASTLQRREPSPFGLVASAKHLTLDVTENAARSPRVRVSGRTLTAFADGGGALVVERTPGAGFDAPFDPAKQTLIYAGVVPHQIAFRRSDVPCAAADDHTVLLFQGKTWREQRLRGHPCPPHAFLTWDGGALLVDSQIQVGWATSSPVEQLTEANGTVLTHVSPTGALSHPTLGLDPAFMAWGGSSAEQTLALVGTYGVRAEAGTAPAVGSRHIVVMRRHAAGQFQASVIVHAEGPPTQSQRTQVREFGAAAVLWPPPARDDGTAVSGAIAEGGDEIAWQGHASSVFKITDTAIMELRFRSVSEQDCQVIEATLAGEEVYALVACPGVPNRVVRALHDAEPVRLALPVLPALPACSPIQVLGRAPADLWIRAECGTAGQAQVQAIFRSGHPQQPLVEQ
jgi:hypothetical protein